MVTDIIDICNQGLCNCQMQGKTVVLAFRSERLERALREALAEALAQALPEALAEVR